MYGEERVYWDAGAVFGLAYFLFVVPLAIGATLWFYRRRSVQPIKARSPELVVLTDIVLILYISLLCMQRVFANVYPCTLNLWSGYVGTLVLFNCYIWRCWTLYFRFRRAQAMEQIRKKDSTSNFFLKSNKWISAGMGSKLMFVSLGILLIPCVIVTGTYPAVRNTKGDDCDRGWSDSVVAFYVVMYLLVFSYFAYQLRRVVDGFGIKMELKLTGICAILGVVPWLSLNSAAASFNSLVFPFSTFCILLAATAAFVLSTVFPLYRSVFSPPVVDVDVPDEVNDLASLIATEDGRASFTEYLKQEFSVENIQFYLEVESLRTLQDRALAAAAAAGGGGGAGASVADAAAAAGGGGVSAAAAAAAAQVMEEIDRIYKVYIDQSSSTQVNLPAQVVKGIDDVLKQVRAAVDQDPRAFNRAPPGFGWTGALAVARRGRCATVFDAAQQNIYRLMETDSEPRYKRTPLYKRCMDVINGKLHVKKQLLSSGIL